MYVSFEVEGTVAVKALSTVVATVAIAVAIAVTVAIAITTTFKALYLAAGYAILPQFVQVFFWMVIKNSKLIVIVA